LDPTPLEKEESQPKVTAIAKPPARETGSSTQEEEEDRNSSLHARRSNTTRHYSRPSTGSLVTTVIEEREDEHSDVSEKMKGMHISSPEAVEEESEVEVPVIVEGEMTNENAPAHPQERQEPRVDVQETTAEDLDSAESANESKDTLDSNDLSVYEHEKASDPAEEDKHEVADSSSPKTTEATSTNAADFATDSAAEHPDAGSEPDFDETVKNSEDAATESSKGES
jgi:hypothetical protein